MDYFQILPAEITVDILSRVPLESALECKLVSKNWNHLVTRHPSFVKMHLHHHLSNPDSGKLGFIAKTNPHEFPYYFEYNENHNQSTTVPIDRIKRFNFTFPFSDCWIVDSCNGLICLAGYNDEEIVCVCNPITKQYVVLLKIRKLRNSTYTFGFGYVSSTNEYKVVKINLLGKESVEVHIYTLGSGNGWRNLGKFNFGISVYHAGRGVFANGALYWISFQLKAILVFDLSEERFRENLSPPPLPPVSDWSYNRLGVLNGCLSFSVENIVKCNVWLLRKKNDDHGIEEQDVRHSLVWSEEFISVGKRGLLAVTKSGGVLTYTDNYLNLYDPKASTSEGSFEDLFHNNTSVSLEELYNYDREELHNYVREASTSRGRLVDFKEHIREAFPHKNTLVSLKALGEEDTKIMESIEIEETECHDKPSVIGA